MATIITKNSSTASSVPLNTQLVQGELAVNVTDKRLFTENASGTVVELGTNPSSLTLPNGTANGVPYLNGSKVLTTGSALTFDGTNLGIGTSSPSAKLHVVSGSDEFFSFGSTGAGWNYGVIRHVSSGDLGYIGDGVSAVTGGANTDLAIRANQGNLLLATNGNNVRATLDSSGNLGLGVTPSAWRSSEKAFQIGAVGSISQISGAVKVNSNVYWNSSNQAIYLTNDLASIYVQTSGVHQWYTAPSGTAGNAITFNQVMTLSPLGSFALLGLGCTPGSIGGDFDVIANQNGIGIGYSTTVYRRMQISSANVMNFIGPSNTATLSAAGAWTNASDARLKKNIADIKYGLNTVMAAQPRSYNRIDVDGDFIGFIAQELKNQVPEVVFGGEDEQYTVDYGSLVAVAFKAIQEQQALINAQSAALEQLKSDVAALKAAA